MAQGTTETPRAARQNIRAVAHLEEELRVRRTVSERVADLIAGWVGTMTFAVLHLVFFAIWVLMNTGRIGWVGRFDPYPFVLLALIVSCEGVLLSTFVLMKQNRMSLAADQRAHLNLQIDMLAEKEITKMLQMQRMICERMGLEEALRDKEVEELSRETAVDQLAGQLREEIRLE